MATDFVPEQPAEATDGTITETGLKSRLARRMAMQIVFVWDADNKPSDHTAESVTSEATRHIDPNNRKAADDVHRARRRSAEAAKSVWEQWEPINDTLTRLAPQWPPHRMPGVDRAILRLATWELLNTPTPPSVVIDEAIELAKSFSTADSSKFVNGVLSSVLQERNAALGIA
ncbi:MAG: transcription antitermination factor NusB [Planctomycetota bacterium]